MSGRFRSFEQVNGRRAGQRRWMYAQSSPDEITHPPVDASIYGMTQTNPPSPWGRWLKEQLDLRNWTQADLVRASDVPQSAVSQWLIREDQKPSIENGRKVAEVFGVSLLEILAISGYITSEEAGIRPSGETTLREASLTQLLSQAQIQAKKMSTSSSEG